MSTATDRRDYSETAEHVTGSRHRSLALAGSTSESHRVSTPLADARGRDHRVSPGLVTGASAPSSTSVHPM